MKSRRTRPRHHPRPGPRPRGFGPGTGRPTAPPAKPAGPSAPAAAPAPSAVHGIDPANLDKSASPCADFFQYATGGWVARNPIPPEQSRWGTFDALGAQEPDGPEGHPGGGRQGTRRRPRGAWTKNSATSTPRPWTRSARTSSGAKPLAPYLEAVAAVKDLDGLAAQTGQAAAGGRQALLRRRARSRTPRTPPRSSPRCTRAGLGLPDRDYYLKDDAQVQGHPRRLRQVRDPGLPAPGRHPRGRRRAGPDRPPAGDGPGQGLHVARGAPGPQGHLPPHARGRAQDPRPGLPVGVLFRRPGHAGAVFPGRGHARVLQGPLRPAQERAPGGLEDLHALARGALLLALPLLGLREGQLRVQQGHDGSPGGPAPLAQGRGGHQRGPRRDAGPGLREEALQPRVQGAGPGHPPQHQGGPPGRPARPSPG